MPSKRRANFRCNGPVKTFQKGAICASLRETVKPLVVPHENITFVDLNRFWEQNVGDENAPRVSDTPLLLQARRQGVVRHEYAVMPLEIVPRAWVVHEILATAVWAGDSPRDLCMAEVHLAHEQRATRRRFPRYTVCFLQGEFQRFPSLCEINPESQHLTLAVASLVHTDNSKRQRSKADVNAANVTAANVTAANITTGTLHCGSWRQAGRRNPVCKMSAIRFGEVP